MRKPSPKDLSEWPKVTQSVKAGLRTRILVSWSAREDAGYSEAMLVVAALKGSEFPPTLGGLAYLKLSLNPIPCSLIARTGPPPTDFLPL